MLTFASQTFANGVWTLTPEEPATLQLAVVGFAMLATYAAATGWRHGRNNVAARARVITEREDAVREVATRRAA